MPTPMREWVTVARKKYEDMSVEEMSHREFLRDPPRAEMVDPDRFFSPADGIIINQRIVQPGGELIEAKGVHVTLDEMMAPWEVEGPCLVCSIFMTFWDVHVNRMPCGGWIDSQPVEPLRTANLPMLFVEHGILEKEQILKKNMLYVRDNARVLNRVQCHWMNYDFFIVQIADSDVTAIMPFQPESHPFIAQSERFAIVRWGSEVAMVLPLDKRFKFTPLCRVTDHVEAGTDALFRIDVAGRTA